MRQSCAQRTQALEAFPALNPIAEASEVRKILDRGLGPNVLPRRKDRPLYFTKAELADGLYVAERHFPKTPSVHLSFSDASKAKFSQEEEINRQFWDEGDARELVFVLGNVGSGKSTFIDFYFRYYCPNESEFKHKFSQKLVVTVDLMALDDVETFTDRFYYELQKGIKQRCAEHGIDITSQIGHPTANIRHWIRDALDTISAMARPSNASVPFRYIVLVLDNLDQSSIDFQKRVLNEAVYWVNYPGFDVYRVYIPLWPDTLDRLIEAGTQPLPTYCAFYLGAVSSTDLLTTRMRYVRDKITTKETEGFLTNAISYLEYAEDAAKRVIVPLARKLANDNLRRELFLWDGVVSGVGMYEAWRRTSADEPRLSEYAMLDALICGKHSVLVGRTHGIANLFAIMYPARGPLDLLIGPHALSLLADDHMDRKDLHVVLGKLGYDHESLKRLLRQLRKMDLFHEAPSDGTIGQMGMLLMHSQTIDAYRQLLLHPAYVDNAAMVTPIDDSLAAGQSMTVSFSVELFSKRVETTMCFIRQLRSDETSFAQGAHISGSKNRLIMLQQLEVLRPGLS